MSLKADGVVFWLVIWLPGQHTQHDICMWGSLCGDSESALAASCTDWCREAAGWTGPVKRGSSELEVKSGFSVRNQFEEKNNDSQLLLELVFFSAGVNRVVLCCLNLLPAFTEVRVTVRSLTDWTMSKVIHVWCQCDNVNILALVLFCQKLKPLEVFFSFMILWHKSCCIISLVLHWTIESTKSSLAEWRHRSRSSGLDSCSSSVFGFFTLLKSSVVIFIIIIMPGPVSAPDNTLWFADSQILQFPNACGL